MTHVRPIGPGVAVLGCGPFGTNHLRVWRELGCLRAAVDPDPAARRSVTTRWPDVEVTDDLPGTLARPDIAAVVIATPAATHASLAMQAMTAGKDVLIEKPMALDVRDGELLAHTAQRLGRVLAIGHLLQHHPAVAALLDLVDTGELGNIRYVHSNRLSLGRIRTAENVLWSFAPHDVELLTRILGDVPEHVACHGGGHTTPGVAGTAVVSMSYRGDRQAHIFASWLQPLKEQRLVVVGDRQMAVFDDTAGWERKLTLHPYDVDHQPGRLPNVVRGDAVPVAVAPGEPLDIECREFLDCVRNRGRPRVDGSVGVDVLRVLAAAQRSLDAHGVPQPVERDGDGDPQIHPTASVHPAAKVGRGTKIWHHSTVLEGASIGEDCMLGQNSFVGRNVRIGRGVRLQNNVSVFEGVELSDDVFCGPSMVFTNVDRPRAHVSRAGEFLRTRVGTGATMGANSTIVCGVSIGRYAFVAAGAVVSRDVADHSLVMGVPARHRGWVCSCGDELVTTGDVGSCARCGRRYSGCARGAIEPLAPDLDEKLA